MCQFGLGCTRPVCFFAHSEAQLRHTGVPGGPQPVVAPPEPPMAGAAPPLSPDLPHNRTLLTSISEAAASMQMHELEHGSMGLGADARAISDVLPVLHMNGGPPLPARPPMRGYSLGAGAPAVKSLPLPRGDWGPAGGSGPLDVAGGDAAAAALALARAQLQAQQAERRSGDLRRSISEAAAFVSGTPAPRGARGGGPRNLDAAWTAATAADATASSVATTAALLDQLQRQLAALQTGPPGMDASALSDAAAAAVAAAASPLQSAAQQMLLSQRTDVAGLTAMLDDHQREAVIAKAAATAATAQLDARVAPPRRGSPGSAPGSPTDVRSAPLPRVTAGGAGAPAFSRAPGSGSRSASPASPAPGTGAATSPRSALLVLGDEGVGADALHDMADAPRHAAPDAKGAPACGMGREAAAALLADLPETAVRDLLRALSGGQPELVAAAARAKN
jgi:hypothetical protein